MRWLKAVLIVTLIFGAAACKKEEEQKSGSFKVVQADVEREIPEDLSLIQTGQVDMDSAGFAFDFYKQLIAGNEKNLVFSPYSIRQAFAMVYAGARGSTESQMTDVLNYTGGQNEVHARLNALDSVLETRGVPDDPDAFELLIANALWVQDGFTMLPDYLDVLARNYGAGVQLVNFSGQSQQAADAINQWAADNTRKMISKITTPDMVKDLTVFLANAIYLKSKWQEEFDPEDTEDADFYLLDGTAVKVPMMFNQAGYGLWQDSTLTAVSLPYKDPNVQMVIIMPAEGQYANVEANLDADQFADIIQAIQTTGIILTMPKFTQSNTFDLINYLSQLGMPDLFGNADLSGISSTPLVVSDASQTALIQVDEEGTVAVAVTSIGMTPQLAPPPPPRIDINHPFIYAIYDQPTGTILFLGRVMNPGE